jgi:hypothetical protein
MIPKIEEFSMAGERKPHVTNLCTFASVDCDQPDDCQGTTPVRCSIEGGDNGDAGIHGQDSSSRSDE